MDVWVLCLGSVLGYALIALYLKWSGGVCVSAADLSGKTALVTGANRGIGFYTALGLAKRHARVILAGRDTAALENAASQITAATGNRDVTVRRVDLGDLESVREFAAGLNRDEGKLDVLVNNAGIGGVSERRLIGGLETMYATNYFGPFLLTHLLLDLLKKSPAGRIVCVTSVAHKLGRVEFDNFRGERYFVPGLTYCHTKLAIIMFVRELSARLQGTDVTVNCLHPGSINSYFYETFPFYLRYPLKVIAALFFKTCEDGAQTSLYCAVSEEMQGVTGQYLEECCVTQPSRAALDAAVAKKLWEVSETLTGLAKHE